MDTHGSVHPHAFPGFASPSRYGGAESGRGMLCLSPPHPPRCSSQHDGASYWRLCALPFPLASLPGDCRFSNRHTLLYYTHRHDGSGLAPIFVPSWRSKLKRTTGYIASPPTASPQQPPPLTTSPQQPHPSSLTPNPSPRGEGSNYIQGG